jgi:Leucine-rich repeat (LRR) protein
VSLLIHHLKILVLVPAALRAEVELLFPLQAQRADAASDDEISDVDSRRRRPDSASSLGSAGSESSSRAGDMSVANSISRKEMERLAKLRSVRGKLHIFRYKVSIFLFNFNFLCSLLPGKLDFSCSELTSIPMEAYAVDPSNIISDLALQFNKIQWVPEVLGSITSLTCLRLHDNLIEVLPKAIVSLVHLKRLMLHNNRLREVPDGIKALVDLRFLSLNNNPLKTLCYGIGALTRLVDLVLDGLPDLETPPKDIRIKGPQQIVRYFARIQEVWHTRYLDLSSSGLRQFPTELRFLESMTSLNLSHNTLRDIPPNNLTDLRELNLSHNVFSKIPAPLISDMSALTVLDLSDNPIAVVPIQIADLQALKVLRISVSPSLQEPPHSVVRRDSHLRYLRTLRQAKATGTLDLRRMDLGVLPSVLAANWGDQDGFDRVTTLRLSGNDLIDVYFGLSHWGTITCLDLDSNKLSSLPREIALLFSVTQLLLSRNLLAELPSTFGELTNINVLALDTNKFRSFPSAILALHSMEKLTMGDNRLIEVHDGVWQLTSLVKLKLNANMLTTLPLTFTRLTRLVSINISNNQLEGRLPDVLGTMANLEDVKLAFNNLTAFPADARHWTQLRALDLSGNKIGAIPLFAASLTTLKKFVITANPLVIIPLQMGALVDLRRFEFDTHDRWISPPASVMQQGADVTLVYLRAFHSARVNGRFNASDLGMVQVPVELSTLSALVELNLQVCMHA